MFNRLTPEQLKAATLLHKPVAVTASAGSGKTSTLVERYLTLLKSGFHPREILTVTFTKEAAQELEERILDRSVELGLEPPVLEEIESSHRIGTIHSLCYSVLAQYGGDIGLLPIRSIIDESHFLSVFLKLYRDWLDQIPEDLLQSLLDHFSHRELEEMARAIFKQRHLFLDCLKLAQEAQAKDRGARVIGLLAKALGPLLKEVSDSFHSQGAYSFDDLETFSLKILRDCPLARTRLRTEIKQILVDEFQDTSAVQWQILSTLIGEQFEKLFIVGDPKQSIYGFRQAEPHLFQEVSSLMESYGGEQIELLRNFRTNPNLLSSLNTLSSHLFEGQPFGWNHMVSGQTAEGDSSTQLNWKWVGTHEKVTKQDLQKEEVSTVVSEVTRLLTQGAEPCSIAILFRNSDRIAEFSDALLAQGIPTQCKRSLSLSRHLDALDLVSFLQFLSDPLNDSALVFFLRSPYVGFSYNQILALNSTRAKQDQKLEPFIFALIRNPPPELRWLIELVQSGESEVAHCLEALFFHCRTFVTIPEPLDALLKTFVQDALELGDIQNFLEAFSSTEFFFQEETGAESSKGVKLMTVHASKGLEFDHVFLVDALRQIPQDQPPLLLKAGLPPGIKFWENDKRAFSGSYEGLLEERRQKETEEARRILYVALTRARKSLNLFVPREEAVKYPAASWAELLKASAEGKLESSPSTEAPIGVGTTL